jgi:Dolichyl-phosphate-mannose-protein mannosyltransferase
MQPEGTAKSTSISPTLLSLVPAFWTGVLFPGQAATPEKFQHRPFLLLLLISSSLVFANLSFHLLEPDEGRYAEIPREMLARGDWLVPYLQGEPYLDKPPLLYWLVMLSYKVTGIHDWSARLVPALALEACILLTFAFGRRWFGDRAAFWSGLLLSLAPGFVSVGRLLIMDGLLTLWVAGSLFTAYEAIRGDRMQAGWWIASACACGLGVLTKGPVALMLLIPPCLAYCWLHGLGQDSEGRCRWIELRPSSFDLRASTEARSSKLEARFLSKSVPLFPSWHWLALFFVVCLAIPLPWYIAICVRSPEFARHFLWEHNVVRFVAPFDHQRPIWYYGPILLVGLLPGSLFLAPLAAFLVSTKREVAAKRSSSLAFVLLAGGWCLLFFSLSGCKLPTYIMPAFPMLALACGAYLSQAGWLEGRLIKVSAVSMFVLLFSTHHIVLPWYAGYRAPISRLAELRDYCADRGTPLICYPRHCDSVAFYVGRDDLRGYRSKQTHLLVQFLQKQPRTVLLLTHRHSLDSLRHALTPDLKLVSTRHFGLGLLPGLSDNLAQSVSWMMGETSLGLCDVAVIERRAQLLGGSIR